MKEYDCRVCGESFTGLEARSRHEKIKHTKTLDKFGIEELNFTKEEKKESSSSRQRTLKFY
jgi:hypothetical protein